MTATNQPVLQGRTAFVTGGTKGLGLAVALRFAQAGADVAVCGRDRRALDAACEELASFGHRVVGLATDVSVHDDVAVACSRLRSEFGDLDILVNNAAWVPTPAPLASMSDDTFRKLLATNLGGALHLTRVLGERMCARGSGTIINMSSIGGIAVNYGDVAYNSTKAALVQFTRSLAAEWGRYGVRVNALLPGFFPTDISREHWENNPALWDKLIARIPLGRAGDAQEIGSAALFLASDASAFVTGAELVVDGGQIAQRELPS